MKSNLFFYKHKDIILFSLVFSILIVLTGNIPFFWTMGYFGSLATRIYESNFTQLIFNIDNGTPPLYAVYIAFLWKVFGKSLMVFHIAALPFIIGILIQLKKLTKALYPKINTYVLFILLLFEPTFITICSLGGYDLCLTFFFFYSMNAIYFHKKNFFFLLSIIIITFINIRGFTIVFGIFLFDVYIQIRNKKMENTIRGKILFILPYFICLLAFIGWLMYHYSIQGWYIVHSDFDSFHKLNHLEMLMRNFIYIFWKIFDFGRFIIWVPLIFMLLKFVFQKKLFNKENTAYVYFLFTLLYYFIFYLVNSYPVSHRYFLLSYIISLILFLSLINKISNKIHQTLLILASCIVLFFGNFIIYPERFGNGWDASLKYLPYFSLKQNIDNYIILQNIKPEEVGAHYPMNFDNYDTNLSETHFKYAALNNDHFKNYKYIILSNISNSFSPQVMEEIENKWSLEKEFKSYQIYIKLYKNPNTTHELN